MPRYLQQRLPSINVRESTIPAAQYRRVRLAERSQWGKVLAKQVRQRAYNLRLVSVQVSLFFVGFICQ